MKPVVTYRAEDDAAYVRLSRAVVHESEEVAPGIILDYDSDGRIVGLEILDARKHLAADALVAAE